MDDKHRAALGQPMERTPASWATTVEWRLERSTRHFIERLAGLLMLQRLHNHYRHTLCWLRATVAYS